MSIEDDLRAQLGCAKSNVAELRQQRTAAEARIKELEEALAESCEEARGEIHECGRAAAAEAHVQQLSAALTKIASCQSYANGDVVSIARNALSQKVTPGTHSADVKRQPIADVIAGLLNVYVRYEDSIDPDHETVEAINRGKAALEALRKDLGTDVPPSSTRAKC